MDLRHAIVFRCDGDDRVGAGHVGRCVPVALACRSAGRSVVFAGSFGGIAAGLLEAADIPTVAAAGGEPAGVPEHAAAVVVDRYGLSPIELRDAAARRPLVAFRDAGRAAAGLTHELDYHLDAQDAWLCGPDYTPLDPRFVAARRGARTGPGLVVLGGSVAGQAVLPLLVSSLTDEADAPPLVAGAVEVAAGTRALGAVRGLTEVLGDVGIVVCGAGVTAYEAACAGVPALLVVLADNQERVARAFAGLAPSLDARGPLSRGAVAEALERARGSALPERGPALVDGYGAFRVRDALLALQRGAALPEPLRYRPAQPGDRDLLLAWRNAPDVRAASLNDEVITADDHARWFSRTLADDDHALLVVEAAACPVGTVRFDGVRGAAVRVSITLAPEVRGRGLGARTLREATELQFAARPGLARITAEVNVENVASLQAFRHAGYSVIETSDAHCLLETLR